MILNIFREDTVMKKMLIFLLVIVANSFVFAENTAEMQQQMFDQFKQIRLSGIQGRITIEETTMSCMQNAKNHDDMLQCEQDAHNSMQTLEENQKQKFMALKTHMRKMHQQQNTELN